MKWENFRYYGTTDPMTRQEAYQCERYLKRNKANIYLMDRYLIDVRALQTPFNLDCFHCLQVHRETCCENGQPYAVEPQQKVRLDDEAEAIVQRYFSAHSRKHACSAGIWDDSRVDGTIGMDQGNCLFYQDVNGVYCCAIHAYAEANTSDVYALKPFSCQLYPIELIRIGERVLVTALTEETAPFSRWGEDYLREFYCSNRERRQRATHIDDSLFRLDDYRPAYQWGKQLLQHEFGESFVELMKQLSLA